MQTVPTCVATGKITTLFEEYQPKFMLVSQKISGAENRKNSAINRRVSNKAALGQIPKSIQIFSREVNASYSVVKPERVLRTY